MKIIWTIAKRELSAYFTSPVAYVFLVIFLLLTGFFTFTAGNFFERGEASLAAFFGWHPWLYLVLVPAVGMRLWAEERRSGTRYIGRLTVRFDPSGMRTLLRQQGLTVVDTRTAPVMCAFSKVVSCVPASAP